jgi:hypothetical protein
MKRLWLLVPVLVLVWAFVSLAPSHVRAQSANAAIHIDNVGCGMLDGNGGIVAADSDSAIVTSSGNSNLRCDATVDPSSGGHAVHFDSSNTGGAECGTPDGLTLDWHETVSASGQATLSCHFHQ